MIAMNCKEIIGINSKNIEFGELFEFKEKEG
jgi:hypothetical protein